MDAPRFSWLRDADGHRLVGLRRAAPQTPTKAAELDETTIDELQRSLESGEWTARRLAEYYPERIDSIDRQGPTLRSILETNPDALELADELAEERRERGPRGPLHGIPVFLKDNILTADRMTTTAGSLALDGSIPLEDSFIDPVELVPSEDYDESEWTVLLYEFKADLNRSLASLGPPRRSRAFEPSLISTRAIATSRCPFLAKTSFIWPRPKAL
jgi:hypothetical protein